MVNASPADTYRGLARRISREAHRRRCSSAHPGSTRGARASAPAIPRRWPAVSDHVASARVTHSSECVASTTGKRPTMFVSEHGLTLPWLCPRHRCSPRRPGLGLVLRFSTGSGWLRDEPVARPSHAGGPRPSTPSRCPLRFCSSAGPVSVGSWPTPSPRATSPSRRSPRLPVPTHARGRCWNRSLCRRCQPSGSVDRSRDTGSCHPNPHFVSRYAIYPTLFLESQHSAWRGCRRALPSDVEILDTQTHSHNLRSPAPRPKRRFRPGLSRLFEWFRIRSHPAGRPEGSPAGRPGSLGVDRGRESQVHPAKTVQPRRPWMTASVDVAFHARVSQLAADRAPSSLTAFATPTPTVTVLRWAVWNLGLPILPRVSSGVSRDSRPAAHTPRFVTSVDCKPRSMPIDDFVSRNRVYGRSPTVRLLT